MTPAPRVAIVVPIHDAGRFLRDTLDSVLAQTATDWVAVLVDDASTDDSRAIAAGYAGRHPERFRLLALDENVGVVGARNRGIAHAPGTELIVLLDHDDLLSPRYLERMTACLDAERARGRRVGIVGCDARLITEDGTPWPQTWGERLGWQDEVTLETLIVQNTIFARALFSREAFERVGGFEPSVAGADDIDLWLRIVQAGWEVAVIPEPLASYRVIGGAMSRNRLHMTGTQVRVLDRLLERGGLTARQRRAAHRRRRHFRGALAMNRVRHAWRGGSRRSALRHAVAGAPLMAIAVLQDPRHWATRRRRDLAAGPGPAAAS